MSGWGWLHNISVSPSKTLTWILAFFCFGVLVGPFFLSFSSLIFLFVSVSAFIIASQLSKDRRVVLLALACFAFGVFRYQQSLLPKSVTTVADHVGIVVRVEATVSSDVERRVSGQQVIVSNVQISDHMADGRILARLPLYPRVHYGDRIAFTCVLERPQPIEGFAYDRQLASRGVLVTCPFPEHTTVRSSDVTPIGSILSLRDRLIARLQAALPEPHAAFVSGLLFGGSSSLSAQTRSDFSRTGLSHILAASGFNISLFSVVLLYWLLQSPFGRRRGLISAGVLLFLYVIVAGATPAVIRAAIMACVLVVQTGIGRKASVPNLLLLALALMLFVNPQLLLNDVGFQLSFVATASLLLIHTRLESRLQIIPKTFGMRAVISSSIVAIIFTLPILLWHFGSLSLLSPIANALVLPFVPLLMILGAVAIVGGTFAAFPAYALSYVLLRVSHALSVLPFSSVSIVYSRLLAVLIAVVLIVWIFYDHYASSSR